MYKLFKEKTSMASNINTKSEIAKSSDEKRSFRLPSARRTVQIDAQLKYKLIDDASKGDITTFKRNQEMLKEVAMKALADYDDRTPLHLAAAQGHLDMVRYMVDTIKCDVFFKDRWGRTAYDESIRSERKDVAEFLKNSMHKSRPENLSHMIIEAAHKGEVQELRRYREQGHDMSFADYDNRTPLHLAVAEGHTSVVEFLIKECKVNQTIKDRDGNTALAEARRCNNKEMEDLILKLNGLI